MGKVVIISMRFNWFTKLKHYLFKCPTFWERTPHFHCPDCGKGYRCYWDGNDIGGKINLCNKCAKNYKEESNHAD